MKKIVLFICTICLCFTAACSENFEMDQSYSTDNVKRIKVYNDSWDVIFKKSDSNEVTVSMEGKQDEDNDPVTVQQDEATLIVKQESQTEGSFMGGFTFGKNGTITIHVPESAINDMELINKSGNIEINEISMLDIQIQNGSGDGKIENVTADTGEFSTDAGMLSMVDSSFQDLNITSNDGEVIMKEIEEGNSLSIDTDAGDISVSYKNKPISLTVMAESDSSDVTLNLEGLQTEEDTEKMKKGMIGEGENRMDLTSNQGVIHITD
ncbi:DUF4097 family beta strand repeat-containing protein [Oceanobacillus jeddahense]|uniref:DUF4097 family beta strand repeat-containing protein n=1 Tax=Oceanobacillus jeddahense TaxID=1462527 RepID=UPI000595E444|nr:DUF4097 family beta strand repeat-containing protein [Oceanobacillus jeddahense]